MAMVRKGYSRLLEKFLDVPATLASSVKIQYLAISMRNRTNAIWTVNKTVG